MLPDSPHAIGDMLRRLGAYSADYDPRTFEITITMPLDRLKTALDPRVVDPEPYDQGDWG